MMPKFTVSIPAYKSKFLKECIQSVLNQEYSDFELIILNDCSPEPVERIVESFNDSRISYFKNDRNVGPENLILNWNRCLNLANGEFIIILGDDDRLDSTYLSEFELLSGKYPNLNVYHCRSKIIDETGKVLELTASWPEYESVYESIWHRLRGLRNQFISDFVYRRKYLIDRGGFFYLPYAWGSDDITFFIAASEAGIAHINNPIFNYRRTNLTISSTGNNEIKLQALMLADKWLVEFLKTIPKNVNDRIIHNNILKIRKRILMKKMIFLIACDLSENLFRKSLYWFKIKSYYGISSNEIIYAFFEAIKKRKIKSIAKNL